MAVVRQPETHDVVVIGSGASGGMAAWNLTRKGVKVLVLDAGSKFDRDRFWTHVLPFEADERLRNGGRPPEFYLDKEEQPYLTPEGKPFNLTRVWGHGGKTNVWGRVSLRMSDLELHRGRARWLGSPLADSLSRHRSVLRPGRRAHRGLRRRRRLGGAAGKQAPDAAPSSSLRRGDSVESGPPPRDSGRAHATRQPHPESSRLPRLSLLRQMRLGLRYRVFLQLRRSPSSVRTGNRQPADPVERGRLAYPRRRQRPPARSSTSSVRPAASSGCAAGRSSWAPPVWIRRGSS